ncbi:FAD-dependent monooxygenase [Alloalcanivorax marinus]|uniref:FAD-dependent monooxygenase n=1 Tax=Alloalcanivorax marinus TaxID=1177169 RepID=UPI00193334B3|nr:FAD-dependent monooxygenase [Alloalcanivorax marinus]MBL7251642.1 FAD-dependent monooxygenase [Alloalcanivorax marinus]
MMTGSNAPKVLIVGAGPTGLTLGINLLRAGVPCRIIDRQEERSEHSRALGLHARSLEIFDAMGVLDAVLAEGRPLSMIRVHGEKGPLMDLDFGALASPFPYLLCCPQPRLEVILERRYRRLGGDLWRGAELLQAQQDGSGVTAVVRHDGDEVAIGTQLMVGADGAHSKVRELLGLPFEGHDYREHFLLADVDWAPNLADDAFHGFLLADGNLAAIPMPDGWRLVISENGEPDEEAGEPTLEDFHERLRAALGPETPLPEQARWLSRFTIQRRLVSHYRRNRILLAGDACHVQSPLGAQGMNTGIADAFNLAWKLVLFCRGRGGGALLDSYQRERRPVAEDMLRGVDALSRASLVRARALRGARDSLLRLAGGRPQLARRLVRRASQLDVHYRHSPLVEAGPDAEVGRRRQGPLPGDRVPDAALVSLRDGGPRRVQGLLRQPLHHLLLQLDEAPDHRTRVILHALLSRLPDEYLNELRVTLIGRGDLELDPPQGAMAKAVHRWRDEHGEFQAAFGPGSRLWLMRPDGHLAYRAPLTDADYLLAYLERMLRGV